MVSGDSSWASLCSGRISSPTTLGSSIVDIAQDIGGSTVPATAGAAPSANSSLLEKPTPSVSAVLPKKASLFLLRRICQMEPSLRPNSHESQPVHSLSGVNLTE